MTIVAVSHRARADLRAALDYRAVYSDQAVGRLADAFDDLIGRLTRFPGSGSPRPELLEGLRVALLGPWRLSVYYHVLEQEGVTQVLVVRVLRQERDVGMTDIEAGL